MKFSVLIKFFVVITFVIKVDTTIDINCNYLNNSTCVVDDIKISTEGKHLKSKQSFDVREIIIHDHLVKFIPKDIEKIFPFLVVLRITKSKLQSIEGTEINLLNNLTIVDLRENALTTIDERTFDHLPIIEINLCNNRIQKIENHLFSTLNNLKTLKLGRNSLKELNEDIFKFNYELEHLELNSNELSFLPTFLFSNQKKLKNLKLENNELSHLQENLITPLVSLKYLNVSHNFLTEIHFDSFNILQNLESFDFNFNTCTKNITSEESNNIKNLITYLGENCSKIEWFKKKIMKILFLENEKTKFEINEKKCNSSSLQLKIFEKQDLNICDLKSVLEDLYENYTLTRFEITNNIKDLTAFQNSLNSSVSLIRETYNNQTSLEEKLDKFFKLIKEFKINHLKKLELETKLEKHINKQENLEIQIKKINLLLLAIRGRNQIYEEYKNINKVFNKNEIEVQTKFYTELEKKIENFNSTIQITIDKQTETDQNIKDIITEQKKIEFIVFQNISNEVERINNTAMNFMLKKFLEKTEDYNKTIHNTIDKQIEAEKNINEIKLEHKKLEALLSENISKQKKEDNNIETLKLQTKFCTEFGKKIEDYNKTIQDNVIKQIEAEKSINDIKLEHIKLEALLSENISKQKKEGNNTETIELQTKLYTEFGKKIESYNKTIQNNVIKQIETEKKIEGIITEHKKIESIIKEIVSKQKKDAENTKTNFNIENNLEKEIKDLKLELVILEGKVLDFSFKIENLDNNFSKLDSSKNLSKNKLDILFENFEILKNESEILQNKSQKLENEFLNFTNLPEDLKIIEVESKIMRQIIENHLKAYNHHVNLHIINFENLSKIERDLENKFEFIKSNFENSSQEQLFFLKNKLSLDINITSTDLFLNLTAQLENLKNAIKESENFTSTSTLSKIENISIPIIESIENLNELFFNISQKIENLKSDIQKYKIKQISDFDDFKEILLTLQSNFSNIDRRFQVRFETWVMNVNNFVSNHIYKFQEQQNNMTNEIEKIKSYHSNMHVENIENQKEQLDILTENQKYLKKELDIIRSSQCCDLDKKTNATIKVLKDEFEEEIKNCKKEINDLKNERYLIVDKINNLDEKIYNSIVSKQQEQIFLIEKRKNETLTEIFKEIQNFKNNNENFIIGIVEKIKSDLLESISINENINTDDHVDFNFVIQIKQKLDSFVEQVCNKVIKESAINTTYFNNFDDYENLNYDEMKTTTFSTFLNNMEKSCNPSSIASEATTLIFGISTETHEAKQFYSAMLAIQNNIDDKNKHFTIDKTFLPDNSNVSKLKKLLKDRCFIEFYVEWIDK